MTLTLFILTNNKIKPVCPIKHLVFGYKKTTLYLVFKSLGLENTARFVMFM